MPDFRKGDNVRKIEIALRLGREIIIFFFEGVSEFMSSSIEAADTVSPELQPVTKQETGKAGNETKKRMSDDIYNILWHQLIYFL